MALLQHPRLRRAIGVAAAVLLLAAPAYAQPGAPARIVIHSTPISSFDNRDKELRRFGLLEYRGGLRLTSSSKEFGGLSSIRIDPDGAHFIAVTDKARWLRGRIVYAGSTPAGIADVQMAPMLDVNGDRLSARGWYDTESIAEDGGTLYVGIERVHRIVKFDFAKDGLRARGVPIPLPVEIGRLRWNKGLEALAVVPDGLPLAGTLIAISETADASGNVKGFLIGGPSHGEFAVKRTDDFDVGDCALLPGGDMLLLERRASWLRGAVRIRRIALADLRPGAAVDGPVIFYADFGQEIDNLEGLGVHRAATGEIVLTLVSDDNFSPLQRTLLLQFTLVGE
ncbi:MAG: esterase-like activity of phytase family protein [Xanthobacteraceae bacterium]